MENGNNKELDMERRTTAYTNTDASRAIVMSNSR